MSDNPIALKHNKHRIHPCPQDKKLSLLNLLIAQNSALDIIVAVAEDIESVKEAITEDNVKVLNDKELIKLPELKCELLISYDLPSTAIIYMARLAKATDGAIILLDIDEQKQLYPIETLLGRVIKQEIVAGFEYEAQEKMKIAQKPIQRPKGEYAFNAQSSDKPKYDKKPFGKPKYDRPKKDGEKSDRKPFDKPKYDKKPFDKPKRDDQKPFDKPKYDRPKKDGEKSDRKPFDKPKYDKPKRDDQKDKKQNKFLGKDESGKAKFSGKSGDRNHRYDGTPKDKAEAPKNIGRKIPIKARKPKEDSKPNS